MSSVTDTVLRAYMYVYLYCVISVISVIVKYDRGGGGIPIQFYQVKMMLNIMPVIPFSLVYDHV